MSEDRGAAAEPWPATPEALEAVQCALAAMTPAPWQREGAIRSAAGCWLCFPRGKTGPGAPGDLGWAAAFLLRDGMLAGAAVAYGVSPAAYAPGLLALREGPLLETAVRGLPTLPDVLFVNATGRDHPRRAGLALHLGARLDVPSVGVTNRPLLAAGPLPPDERGATSPLRIDGEIVGYWVRTKRGVHPVAVHAGWRTDPETAVSIVLSVAGRTRTPAPLREARRLAREARAGKHPVATPGVRLIGDATGNSRRFTSFGTTGRCV